MSKTCGSREEYMQYLPRRSEITRLRAVLRAGVYTCDRVRASMREHPYAPYTAGIAGVDRERVRRLTLRKKRLEAQCRATERHVESVPDAKTRAVLRLRYLEGVGWRQIGRLLGMSEDAARMRAYRVLR